MVIKIDIQGCHNYPFYDTEWGCNLIDNGLVKECPLDTEDEIIIKNEKER